MDPKQRPRFVQLVKHILITISAGTLPILFVWANPCIAKPKVSEKYTYYYIYPETVYGLSDELKRRTTIRLDGKKYMALTHWEVAWNYELLPLAEGCKVKSFSVDVDIVYTLPQISRRFKAPQEVHRAFNAYYKRLLNHEYNHARHAITAGQEIEQYLIDFTSSESCHRAGQLVSSKTEGILKYYKDVDDEYDVRTNHGESEGVFGY